MPPSKPVVLALPQQSERQAVQAILEQLSVTAFCAPTGREAVIYLEDNDCAGLISDLQLPDMHAWSLLREVREVGLLPRLTIYVFSNEYLVSTLPGANLIVRPIAQPQLLRLLSNAFGNGRF
jgi:CheY-like chemotaxis protein